MKEELKIGYTGCYINDYGFDHIVDIPVETAVLWVQNVCPEAMMSTYVKAKDLTTDNNNDTDATCHGWRNKLFVIVGDSHGKWIALYNHGSKFSIRIKDQ